MGNRRLWICLFICLFGAIGSAAQRGGEGATSGEAFLGKWTGTWDGAGAGGGFELTLEKDKDGAIGGKVEVTGEPAYTVTLKSVSFDAKKMIAKYDFPEGEGGVVVLAATFDGNSVTGTWSLREKATDNEITTGGWAAKRK